MQGVTQVAPSVRPGPPVSGHDTHCASKNHLRNLLGRVSAVTNVTQTASLVIGSLGGGVLGVRPSIWFIEGGLVAVAIVVLAAATRS